MRVASTLAAAPGATSEAVGWTFARGGSLPGSGATAETQRKAGAEARSNADPRNPRVSGQRRPVPREANGHRSALLAGLLPSGVRLSGLVGVRGGCRWEPARSAWTGALRRGFAQRPVPPGAPGGTAARRRRGRRRRRPAVRDRHTGAVGFAVPRGAGGCDRETGEVRGGKETAPGLGLAGGGSGEGDGDGRRRHFLHKHAPCRTARRRMHLL
jgi:hypothetical protein